MSDPMRPVDALVKYGRAWFERDHAKRVELLRECCTEDIVFMDPSLGCLVGLDAVSTMIGGYMNNMSGNEDAEGSVEELLPAGQKGSGVRVDVVTPIEEFHGFFRYSFVWTMPDGTKSGGTDFCEVADDGRMKLITVWPGNDNFPVRIP
jgi:SnoaL-like domain